jgi:hypothetical protein
MAKKTPYLRPLTLLEAAELALFGVTSDADNNDGRVDRIGIAMTLRKAIRDEKYRLTRPGRTPGIPRRVKM